MKRVVEKRCGSAKFCISVYHYVYQYKDHLGNIRLTYRDNNGTLEILEEHNYYPFGLKHKGYNDMVSANVNSVASRFKFQGQELNDELGLNWYSFKWRNADPAIARFFNVDPLAEEYPYNSTYAFSENRVIDGVELEGLEYVSSKEARVFVRPSDGSVMLRMENMTNMTANTFNQINSNPENWAPGTMGASHLNTKAGQMNFGSLVSKYKAQRGIINSTHKIEPPVAKSTGKPDQRFKSRQVGGGTPSPSMGPKAVGSAKALLVVEAINLGGVAVEWISALIDKNATTNHLGYLRSAIINLQSAYADGLIPQQYHNSESFADLLNAILYGDTIQDNDELRDLGITIYNNYSNNGVEEETKKSKGGGFLSRLLNKIFGKSKQETEENTNTADED